MTDIKNIPDKATGEVTIPEEPTLAELDFNLLRKEIDDIRVNMVQNASRYLETQTVYLVKEAAQQGLRRVSITREVPGGLSETDINSVLMTLRLKLLDVNAQSLEVVSIEGDDLSLYKTVTYIVTI